MKIYFLNVYVLCICYYYKQREMLPLQSLSNSIHFSLKSELLKWFQMIQFILFVVLRGERKLCFCIWDHQGKNAFLGLPRRVCPPCLSFSSPWTMRALLSLAPWTTFMDKHHFTSNTSTNIWKSAHLLSRTDFPPYANKPHVYLKKYKWIFRMKMVLISMWHIKISHIMRMRVCQNKYLHFIHTQSYIPCTKEGMMYGCF